MDSSDGKEIFINCIENAKLRKRVSELEEKLAVA